MGTFRYIHLVCSKDVGGSDLEMLCKVGPLMGGPNIACRFKEMATRMSLSLIFHYVTCRIKSPVTIFFYHHVACHLARCRMLNIR